MTKGADGKACRYMCAAQAQHEGRRDGATEHVRRQAQHEGRRDGATEHTRVGNDNKRE